MAEAFGGMAVEESLLCGAFVVALIAVAVGLLALLGVPLLVYR